ncbi:MAG: DUF1929 domain-containing protein [Planctomycetes bacterium]|nr:DUF1929 domain-containing protein [Planctomycetota bacterium]
MRSRPQTPQAAVCYGTTIPVDSPQATQITSISLMRRGITTHGFDQAARFMKLNFSASSANRLFVSASASGNHAPPGYSMCSSSRAACGRARNVV